MTCGTEYAKQVEARRLSGGKNKVIESYKPEDTLNREISSFLKPEGSQWN